ncbi:DUF11 domain-containing protein [Salsipaludibacter albus]|uniref:DUF11 domain-containing protein n=1 Tax=Salsipaludibacter albus TaxID=2849650 RepID=UPI001EE424B3|nr:DUF11 domain-containing protein [Salsipaludibacter albus]MBY5162498.1 DUF11 domain-containing protein [Salsipaludibacter albus]
MKTTAEISPFRRRLVLWLALLVGLVIPAVAYTTWAEAALPGHTAPGEFTKFEIDGNIAGANDWAGGGYGPYTTPQNRPSTGTIGFTEAVDACEVGTEDGWAGALEGQPFPWTVETESMPRKTDICEFGAAYEIVDVDGEYHYVLYGYAARAADATGDQSLFFLLDRPGQAVGDIILEYDFDPSGSSQPTELRWDGSDWASSTLSAGVQEGVGPNPFVPGANPETFVEFAIDLTANEIFPPVVGGVEQCITFVATGFATNNSNSLNSQLKDRAAFPGDQAVTNCTEITISKEANVDAPGVEFLYELDQADGETVHDGTLDPPDGVTDLDGGPNGIAANIEVGESHLWQNVIAEPDYQLQEAVPDGWDLVDITCTWYDPFLETTRTEVVTTGPDDANTIEQTFQIPPPTVDNGVKTSCVITNETSGLVIAKAGEGAEGSEFTFSASPSPEGNYVVPLNGDTGVIAYDPGTDVTIEETALPDTEPGWVYQGAECLSDAEGAEPVLFDVGETVEVTTVGGEVITCTFTNNQQGQINVAKEGQPADGGPFGFDTNYDDNTVDPDGSEDFSLTIDGPANNSDDLAPGEYTIVELLDEANLTQDPDYTLGDVACEITTTGTGDSTFTTSVDDANAVVDLAAGDIVDCTFTNVQAGRLIVVKETDFADDTFEFSGAVSGTITTFNGATDDGDELMADLAPDTDYTVDETVPAGWDATGATCDNGSGTFTDGDAVAGLSDIEITAGDTVTCTFTNERETANLTLTKQWGPDAVPDDTVELTATGDDPQTAGPAEGDSTVGGATNDAVLTVYPGEVVTLEEAFGDNVADYEALLGCDPGDAGTLDYTEGDLSGTFTVPDDDPVDVTCTFVNERLRAELTLEKEWVDGFGGDTAEITADGSDSGTTTSTAPDGASVTIDVLSGEVVDLSEVLGDNTGTYTTTLECTDEDGLNYVEGELDGTYEVPMVPENVTCTFTNTRTSTTLTLDKSWTNPADGDSVDLAITGEAGEGTGTVAGDGSTDEPATLTVYSGEVVDLAEAFAPGNPDWYSTLLTCDSGTLGYTADALSGTLEITATPDAGISCQFSNVRETAQVIVAKDVAPDTDSGLFDLSINGNVEVDDAGDGDASDPVEVFVGDPVTVSEAAGTGTDLANYDSELACDNDIAPEPNTGTSGEFTIGTADLTVTCTFTNTRKSAELTLTKDWVNGADGDMVSLTASGDSGNSVDALGSSTAPDTDSDAVLTIWAGEAVTLSEAYAGGNTGSYTAELSCTEDILTYTSGDISGSYGVPSDPVDVTCTFVNTRTSAELTLDKDWVDGADGDTADLDITATLGSDPADGATATADGTIGTSNDGTTVTAEVLSGETVTLDEVLGAGNTGSYDSTLSCDAAGLEPEPTTGTTGEYTMPFDPSEVTCTFTNTRTRVDLVLDKEWIDAAAGDEATLTGTGAVDDATDTSTASGAAGSELDSPVVTLEVLSGETVALEEVLGDNDAVYATSLACTDGDLAYDAGELDGELTVPSDATEDITCTFTNEAGRGNIVIVKNVEGADGTFDFTGDWPDPDDDDASLVGDFSITTVDETGSATWTGVLVPPDGEPYTVTELDPTPEYDGTDLVCVDPDGGSSVDGLTGSIDLDVGETVTCTYTNTQRSTITVIKDAVPDDDQAFTFTTSGDPLPDTFDLVDDGTDTTNSFTSDLLPADDTYSVEETPVEGWTLSSATCDNGDSPDAIDPEPGQNVTCTFVNEAAPGSVVVTKNVEGVADTYAWSFDIAIDPVDAGVTSPQTVSGTGNSSDTVTFEPLTLNQTYTILEPDLPAGWEQTVFDCGPDAEPDTEGYQVRITEPGQQIDCTITNEAQPSSVAVYKTVEGVADDFTWSFDFTIDPATDGEPATQTASGTGNTTEFVLWENLVPGETYTITESEVEGFDIGEFACTGLDDLDDDPTSVTFVAPLGTAQEFTDVTCTVTNTAVPSEVEVTKTVEGITGDLAWSFDFTISPVPTGQDATLPASGSGAGEATVGWTDLVPGEIYTITETTEDGYDAGVLVCDGVTDLDGADDASVQFEAPLGGDGLEIDCSITNVAEPSSVAVYKSVEGVADDYAWSFDFTIDPETVDEDATQTASGVGNTTEFVVWENLVPGETYTITEAEVDGFDIGEFACTGLDDLDDDPTSVTFVAPLGLVQEFTDVTCTVTNTAQPGQVTITKTTLGGDGSFTFAITPDGGDPVEYEVTTVDGTGEVTIGDLLPGETYTISELDPGSSWIADDLTCTVARVDGSMEMVDPVGGFTVEVGDEIACGITNTAKGTIVIVKNVEGADGTFEFTGDWTPDGSEVTFPVTTMGGTGSETFVDVDPGEYTVSEVDPYPDYIAEAISCIGDVEGDDSSVDGLVGTINLDPGEIVTCTFGNTETATVVVDKVTDPADDPTAFDFQFGPLDGDATDFVLADADAPEVFGGLAPGDYLLDELVPDGWVLTDVTCSPEQFVDGTQATITVEAGDTVTCTYTNSGRGDLVIDKTVTSLVEPGDASFTVTYDLVVTGDSAVAEPYTVTDELLFGDGITVDAATVTSTDGTVNGDWDGETVLEVTDGTQSLPAGDTHTYTVEVSGTVGVTSTSTSRDCVLDEGEDGTGLLNEATVTYDNGSNTDDACDEPEEPQADLAVTKTGPGHIVLQPGQTAAPVDYTITVTNLGPGTAVDAVATDTLPEGLDVTDVTTSVGTCDVADLVITCDLGDMAPDDVVTIMVSGITTPFLDDTFTNVVEVTSSTPDPDPDNNRDTVTTTITKELPRTGLELTWLAMLAALLLLAGLAMRDLGRVAARSTTRKR